MTAAERDIIDAGKPHQTTAASTLSFKNRTDALRRDTRAELASILVQGQGIRHLLARYTGLMYLAVSWFIVAYSYSGPLEFPALLFHFTYAAMVVAYWLYGYSGNILIAVAIQLLGMVTSALLWTYDSVSEHNVVLMGIEMIPAGCTAAVALGLTVKVPYYVLIVVFGVWQQVVAIYFGWHTAGFVPDVLLSSLGWIITTGLGIGSHIAIRRAENAAKAVTEAKEIESAAHRNRQSLIARNRMLHDTLLSTLSMLSHAGRGTDPEVLRAAAAKDLRVLQGAELIPELSPDTVSWGAVDHDVAEIAQDIQSESFTVTVRRVSGIALHGAARVAVREAVREALANAKRHSGCHHADVVVSGNDGQVTVVIVDRGKGFELESLPGDRLGVRESIIARVTDAGGTVKIFTSPGKGTTILISLGGA